MLGFVSSQVVEAVGGYFSRCKSIGNSCIACDEYDTCVPAAGGGFVGMGGADGCLMVRPSKDCKANINPTYYCLDDPNACVPRMPWCVFKTGFGWVPTPCVPGGAADCSDCAGN